MQYIYLLGQGSVLHSMLSIGDPTQSDPLCFGAGFVQVLNLLLVPPLHSLLQVPNGVQSDQLPWTGKGKGN